MEVDLDRSQPKSEKQNGHQKIKMAAINQNLA